MIEKCGNDRESYDDRKCDNMTGRATGCLKKVAPIIGFLLFSPAGWFYMGRNDTVRSGHTVASVWTPHLPIFGKKMLGPYMGPQN